MDNNEQTKQSEQLTDLDKKLQQMGVTEQDIQHNMKFYGVSREEAKLGLVMGF